jgi:hypothetical protein
MPSRCACKHYLPRSSMVIFCAASPSSPRPLPLHTLLSTPHPTNYEIRTDQAVRVSMRTAVCRSRDAGIRKRLRQRIRMRCGFCVIFFGCQGDIFFIKKDQACSFAFVEAFICAPWIRCAKTASTIALMRDTSTFIECSGLHEFSSASLKTEQRIAMEQAC